MAWYVEIYEKTDEGWLVKSIPTSGIDEKFIREVWSLPEDDTVVGAEYRITTVELARVQDHIAETIDLNAYSYTLGEE